MTLAHFSDNMKYNITVINHSKQIQVLASGALKYEDSTFVILLLHDKKLEFAKLLFEDLCKRPGFRRDYETL